MKATNSVGVFTTDRALHIRVWDPVMAAFSGISAEAAAGKAITEVIPNLESRGLLRHFNRALDEGVVELLVPAFHKYLILCAPSTPSSQYDYMRQRVTIAPLENNGQIEGLIVTVEDVTPAGENQSDGDGLISRLDSQSWQVRNTAAAELGQRAASDTIAALLLAIRDRHHDLGLLNSALKVLTLTHVDTHSTLVEFLRGSDPDLRIQAALAMGVLKDQSAGPALIGALEDANQNVVYHAIEALGALRIAEAVDPLVRIAEQRDFFLSFPALEALGEIGDARVATHLVSFLQESMFAEPAARALAKIGDESIVLPLAELLNRSGTPADTLASSLAVLHDRYEYLFGEGQHIADLARLAIGPSGIQSLLDGLANTSPANLRAFVLVLGWLESPAAARALALHLGRPDLRNEIVDALVGHGNVVTELLIEQLKSEDLDTREAALTAIGRIRDKRAVPALTVLLRTDSELAIPIIAALASIGDPRATDPLFEFAGHPDDAIRRATVSALNTLASSGLCDRVLPLLDNHDPLVRETAVRIAGYFGYRSAIDALLARCCDEDERVRRAAIEHLPYLEDPRVSAALVYSLQKGTPAVRAAAATALGHVEFSEVAAAVIGALKDSDPWVRYFAARTLGRQFAPQASAPLEEAARLDKYPQVRIAAFEALSQMGEAERAASVAGVFVRTGNLDLQQAVAGALGTVPQPARTELLQEILRSPHPMVRAAAVKAMEVPTGEANNVEDLRQVVLADPDLGVARAAASALKSCVAGSEGVAALIDVLGDTQRRHVAVEALSEPGGLNIGALREGLRKRSPQVRLALVQVLERIKHPAAAELLRLAFEDPDSNVQTAAAAALSRNQPQ